MKLKEQLSNEKWRILFNTPIAASTYVATASGGGLEIIKELFSASKFMQEFAAKSGKSGYGSLVNEFLEDMKGLSPKDVQENTIKYNATDLDSVRAEAKQLVEDGAKIALSLDDGVGFSRWILEMAQSVTETKTGGILGIGGTSVIDAEEQKALDELAIVLGIK